ncbi:MAG: recombinase family protein [Oscillospiraceae bacterium]|nr:recombinase family protein [Oscillospiraceae bacterium]
MLNVAAYCRVSTDKDDQANSFESQKRYFEEYIKRNPDWELTEIYADEGLTGTTTKKRKAFNKMIADAHLGKFDRVLTKEVSRFARNTVDTLQFTRELKAINIGVLFMLDNIDTLAPDGELRLTIMASLAQEESRKTSERVKWGQKRQMEKGVVFGRDMLGYDVRGGKMYINEEGAEIVKLIFHKFVNEKKGTYTISRELREAGYKTITGNAMWTNTVILKALRNEKYCGDLIQRKTYTPDYLTHAKKYNHGEEEFVIIRNHHEPIISRELWDMAQEELDKRTPSEEIKSKHSNRYLLSGKIVCGCCGNKFVARSKKRKDGSVYKAWRCYNAAQHGTAKIDKTGNHIGCDVKSQIRDEDFMLAIQKVVECLDVNRDAIIKGLTDVLKNVFSYEKQQTVDKAEIQKKLTNLRSRQEKLLDLYLSEDLSQETYREKKALYETEISEFENILNGANTETISYDYKQAINDITEYITNLLYATERDEIFYKNLVEKIVVHSREDIDIYLDLLPHKWKVVLNSALDADDLCGSILSTI